MLADGNLLAANGLMLLEFAVRSSRTSNGAGTGHGE